MIKDMYSGKSDKDIAQETTDLFNTFNNGDRQNWALYAREDEEFRGGKQWTAEQVTELQARQQAPLVINRIHPAVEMAKAMLTANKPTFRVVPSEDSDNQTAHAFNGLIQYIWNISEGDMQMFQLVDDFYVKGVGAIMPFIDPMADGGRGEIKIRCISPYDIYVDPNSRDRFCSDASDIIVSREYTKGQLERMYPMYRKAIKAASGNMYSDEISTGNALGTDSGNEIFFPGRRVSEQFDGEYVRAYERYTKVWLETVRVFEEFSKQEFEMSKEKFEEYSMKPVWSINGQIVTDEIIAQKVAQNAMKQYQEILSQYEEAVAMAEKDPQYAEALSSGQMQPPPKPEIQQMYMSELIEAGMVKVVLVPIQRVRLCVVVGDEKLYERILPCDEYPIVMIMNMHTGTPYPLSDVRMVKDMQRYINKVRSLIIAHASTSTNVKVLVPRGTDADELAKKWAQPGAIIEVDFADGTPIPVQPLPMPNELYQNELTAKQDIDHQLGLYESMMGNGAQAPDTYRGIMMMDEFGQRKIKSKQSIIEAGLQRLGKLIIQYIQEFYSTEKQFKILQPNNSLTEYMVNKRAYDDYGNVIGTLNDVSRGKYDVLIITGSTLPSNRYAQLDFYMDAYKNQIVDRIEVLKKTDIFDMEGVLKRIDTIDQLQGALQQMQEENKKLKGDLQTRERELFHSNMRAAVAQETSKMGESAMETRKAEELYRTRLADTQKMAQQQANLSIQEIKQKESMRAGRNNNQQRKK